MNDVLHDMELKKQAENEVVDALKASSLARIITAGGSFTLFAINNLRTEMLLDGAVNRSVLVISMLVIMMAIGVTIALAVGDKSLVQARKQVRTLRDMLLFGGALVFGCAGTIPEGFLGNMIFWSGFIFLFLGGSTFFLDKVLIKNSKPKENNEEDNGFEATRPAFTGPELPPLRKEEYWWLNIWTTLVMSGVLALTYDIIRVLSTRVNVLYVVLFFLLIGGTLFFMLLRHVLNKNNEMNGLLIAVGSAGMVAFGTSFFALLTLYGALSLEDYATGSRYLLFFLIGVPAGLVADVVVKKRQYIPN
jgi:hypothetical protein